MDSSYPLLSKLEYFTLHDPSAQQIYRHHLSSLPIRGLVNHIDFFIEYISLEELQNNGYDNVHSDVLCMYGKFFNEESEYCLRVQQQLLDKVKDNINNSLELDASVFKPVFVIVLKDLAHVYFPSFVESVIFKEFKEQVLSDFEFKEEFSYSAKEREMQYKLKRFFGEPLNVNSDGKRRSFNCQPNHIKEYKLRKIFGERVSVDKLAEELELVDNLPIDSSNFRRSRRLHVFFGDYFKVDDVMFSERVRASEVSTLDSPDTFHNQPNHVNAFKLKRFFGERILNKLTQNNNELIHDNCFPSRHNKIRRMHRFFGERVDFERDSSYASFAKQPSHVSAHKLRKIFGEYASHAIPNNTEYEYDLDADENIKLCPGTKRAFKLYKFFGTKEITVQG